MCKTQCSVVSRSQEGSYIARLAVIGLEQLVNANKASKLPISFASARDRCVAAISARDDSARKPQSRLSPRTSMILTVVKVHICALNRRRHAPALGSLFSKFIQVMETAACLVAVLWVPMYSSGDYASLLGIIFIRLSVLIIVLIRSRCCPSPPPS